MKASEIARTRWFGTVALGTACVAWVAALIAPQHDSPGYDLSALVVGAKLVADGDKAQLYAHHAIFYNLADSPAFLDAARALGFTGTVPTAFVQAPLVAFVAQPLTHVSFPVLLQAWNVFSAAALAWGLWLALEAYAPRLRTHPVMALLMLAMLPFEPVRYMFWLGQTTPMIFAAVLGAIVLLRRGRPLSAGLLMALPAFVKLTPLVFGLVWLWQKRWRALAGLSGGVATLATASIATMGWACNVTYVHRVREIGRIVLVAYNNHSIGALLTRPFVSHDELDKFTMFTPTPAVRAAVVLCALALVATPAWLLRARRRDPLAEAFALLLTLLVPSISWTHYFVLLVPLALLAVHRATDLAPRARTAVLALTGAAMLVCMRPFAPDESAFASAHGLLIVGPTLAGIVVAGVLTFLAVRTRTAS